MRFHLTTQPCPKDTRTRIQKMHDREKDREQARFMGLYFVFVFVPLFLISIIFSGSDEKSHISVPSMVPQAQAEIMTEPEPVKSELDILHDEICASVANSPLCTDSELLKRLDIISKEKGVPTRLMTGIMYAESHIGVNFNREACRVYHNWAGLKGRKYDNGKTEWFTKYKRADGNGCWLYKFSSIEQGFYSLANTISIGYKGCENNTVCISYKFVGNPDVSEKSWVNNVGRFYPN